MNLENLKDLRAKTVPPGMGLYLDNGRPMVSKTHPPGTHCLIVNDGAFPLAIDDLWDKPLEELLEAVQLSYRPTVTATAGGLLGDDSREGYAVEFELACGPDTISGRVVLAEDSYSRSWVRWGSIDCWLDSATIRFVDGLPVELRAECSREIEAACSRYAGRASR